MNVENATTTMYGGIMPFKTLFRQATVTSLPAVNMTDTTAVLKGQTAQNDETIFEQGFEWREYGTTKWDTIAVFFSPLYYVFSTTGCEKISPFTIHHSHKTITQKISR